MRDFATNLRWLPVVGVIAAVAALRATAPVTMPLALAVFLVMLFWPVQGALSQYVPRALAMVVTLLLMAVVSFLFGWGVYYCIDVILQDLPVYLREIRLLVADLAERAVAAGLPGSRDAVDALIGQIPAVLGSGAQVVTSTVQTTVLVLVFLVLAQDEAHRLLVRIQERMADRGERLLSIGNEAALRMRKYVVVRTFSGLVCALATILWCWALDVPEPVAWGLLAWLLFYIPTLGNIAAAIPPALVALIQGGVGHALIVTAGLAVIQLVTGSWLDTKLQGNQLAVSPMLVLFAVIFWGWVWGVPGAILGIPVTGALLLVCAHYDTTRWIADLLSELSPDQLRRSVGQAG